MRRVVIRGTGVAGSLGLLLALAGAAAAAGSASPLAAPTVDGPSGTAGLIAWLSERQQVFQQTVVDALKELRAGAAPRAFAVLVGAGFLYGVVHAAGPGHGKAIVSSYLLTHPADRRRALVIAAAAALLQGLVAIALVGGMIGLLDLAARQTRDAARWVEIASFGLVAAVGLALLARAIVRASARLGWWSSASNARGAHPHAHRHGHIHIHIHQPDDEHACCGPDPAAVADARGPIAVAGLVLACGLRPCTGAILVLVLAFAMDLAAAGIASVLAMSVGTGLTVAAVALGSRAVRSGAVTLSGRLGLGPAAAWTGIAATAVGGLLVTLTGALLLAAAFQPRHPLL
ncbi:MAG: hypothetical protein RID91_05465 [Azospirillaceae bacterium]